MKHHPLDWLLLAIAAVAVVVGIVINPPTCILVFGPGPPGCVEWHFPFEIAGGVVAAAIVLTIVAVRIRRRSRKPGRE